jgi:hypothetical protein
MFGDKKSRQAELSRCVAVWGDRIGEDNAREYQGALGQGQLAFVIGMAWLALTIAFQLRGTGMPIAVVTLLAWPVMIYLWGSSLRKIWRVDIAVLDRYGLPRRLRWNIPLNQTDAFDRWLTRHTAQPR